MTMEEKHDHSEFEDNLNETSGEEEERVDEVVQPDEGDAMGEPAIPVEIEHIEKPDDDLPQITATYQAKAVLESLLFATTEPLTLPRLQRVLGLSIKSIRGILLQLQMDYHRNSPGLQIIEVAGGYQMATRPECHPWVAKLKIARSKSTDNLSVATLETLAIIAYKQPVTRLEVETIRGVDSSSLIRKLQDLGLVKVVGKNPPPRRSHLYGTTKEFLRMFGLKSVKDLPSLADLKQLMGIDRKIL